MNRASCQLILSGNGPTRHASTRSGCATIATFREPPNSCSIGRRCKMYQLKPTAIAAMMQKTLTPSRVLWRVNRLRTLYLQSASFGVRKWWIRFFTEYNLRDSASPNCLGLKLLCGNRCPLHAPAATSPCALFSHYKYHRSAITSRSWSAISDDWCCSRSEFLPVRLPASAKLHQLASVKTSLLKLSFRVI